MGLVASIARPGVQNRFIYGTQGGRKYLFCGFILALGQLLDLQNQPRKWVVGEEESGEP